MMGMIKKILPGCLAAALMVIVLLGSHKSIFANPYNEVIKQANIEYSSGYYDQALELYIAVVEQGYESAELYYNIGNTFFKLNRIPESILYYERAKRLAPRDENIRFNLELARTRTIDKIESIPELFYERWFRSLLSIHHADGWGKLSIVFIFLAMALAVVFLLTIRRWLRVLSFYLGLVFIIFSLITLAFAFTQHYQRTVKAEAIVFDPTVTVKSSPSEGSIDLFVIHEGTKVRITDRVGEWMEVRIASGSMGWLKANAVEKI
ncbi:MAG TPA: tetratricopeptide repeat protein [Bacteroidales bacterium]|nr:tetratricopeptide repeat protein [Bacteroidales bacterium]